MWTSQQLADVLQKNQTKILQGWRKEAQTRLWHLDKEIFSGQTEPAVACASATLSAFIAYYQSISGVGGATENADLASGFPVAPLFVSVAEANAFVSGGNENGLRPESATPFLDCAAPWVALPITWADLCTLLSLLITEIRQQMVVDGADDETLLSEDKTFHTLVDTVANLRIEGLEKQLASQRDEAVMTQHLAGRFLANASHEIRTPLTAVVGFSELLVEETYGPLSEEQRAVIGHIENSAQNLLEIVNNLLDLLHIRAGKLTLQYRPVNIGELLRHLYNILNPLAKRKNVHFHLELPEEPGVIEADENIVRHIIYHLLSSGIRATPAGGTVLLSTEREGGNLVIITKDTALHLPPEAVANMLDPFPRLENSPVRGYDGWEVGLPLVRRYVELHGGELEITSLPDHGTLFRILLPVARTDKKISNDGELIRAEK